MKRGKNRKSLYRSIVPLSKISIPEGEIIFRKERRGKIRSLRVNLMEREGAYKNGYQTVSSVEGWFLWKKVAKRE